MDIKNRIEIAKMNLKKAENQKTIKETQLAAAEKQRDEVVEKMAKEGVTPETVGQEVEKLESEITENLTKIEKLLPRV
jgi:ParB-like chromosome segregation protein Spo0J